VDRQSRSISEEPTSTSNLGNASNIYLASSLFKTRLIKEIDEAAALEPVASLFVVLYPFSNLQ
jgi:hypothetical protein